MSDDFLSFFQAQFTEKPNSKHYSDHETVGGAIEAVCQLFEAKLKQANPDKKKITYDISELFQFLDDLPDLAILVYVVLRKHRMDIRGLLTFSVMY